MQKRSDKERRRWRIGEVAEATGLSVRTLHHYEHVGLLAAGSRTEGGQRLYDERDLRRIVRVRALRDLGMSLAEVARVLEDDDERTLAELLRAHLEHVDAEIERLARLRAVLAHACAHASREGDPDVLATVEAMSRVASHADARVLASDPAGPTEVEAAWRALGDELRASLQAGAAPSSRRASEVARRIRARLVDFAAGDPTMLDALARLRQHAPPESHAGWDPPLLRYLDEALAALPEGEQEGC